jgi:hypothetical protein
MNACQPYDDITKQFVNLAPICKVGKIGIPNKGEHVNSIPPNNVKDEIRFPEPAAQK